MVNFRSCIAFTYERIDKKNAVLLVVDLQEGLYQIARDQSAVAMKNNILAHAELGKIFGLPTILTTSTENGTFEPLLVFSANSAEVPNRTQRAHD